MKLLNLPRQPFVGLAGMAGLGIILADFLPRPSSALLVISIVVAVCCVTLLRWPMVIPTYAIVGLGFFLLQRRFCLCPIADGKLRTRSWPTALNLRSDIIIKGQHHSGQSGSDRFLDAVRPQLIIATSRDFPEYERISDKWAEHVRARSIKLFRQDETGAVTVRFGRGGWEAQSYFTGETFRSANQ
jgi:hypothetical protein